MAELTEAQLKKIFPHDPGCSAHPDNIERRGPCDCLRGELIAALRDAWRERDAQEKQRLMAVESSRDYYNQRNIACEEISKQRERADRAEAELKQLREDAGRFVAESAVTNAKLQDVREAAESGDIWFRVKHTDPGGQILVNAAWFANLRRALDAAKDPAR